jgi:hypothetical protein
MRAGNWLFVVSVALFVSGIGFVIAAARQKQESPPVPRLPTAVVASVKQLMNGIIDPAADVVFGSVSTIITAEGTEERAPRTDEEWETVGNSAVALAESANLLMMDGRAIDADWIRIAKEMADASLVALKAVEAKDPEAVLASGEGIYMSCETCHQRYQR